MLTPIDIQKRVFKNAIRGYDKKEVDEFMAIISESLEKRIAEFELIKDSLLIAEEELKKFKNIENTLSETLLFAKQTSDEMINSAKERDEIMLRETELKMDQKIREKHAELIELDQRIERLNRRHEASKIKMQNFLKMELQLLDNEIPKTKNAQEIVIKENEEESREEKIAPEDGNQKKDIPRSGRAIIFKNLSRDKDEDEDEDLPYIDNITE